MSSINELSNTLYRAARFSEHWSTLFMVGQALSHAGRAPERHKRIGYLRQAAEGINLFLRQNNPGRQVLLRALARAQIEGC